MLTRELRAEIVEPCKKLVHKSLCPLNIIIAGKPLANGCITAYFWAFGEKGNGTIVSGHGVSR
jgi:hypothetical protein